MDLFPDEQNFDLDKSRQIFYHSLKEHRKISNIPNSEVSLRNVVKCGKYSTTKFAVFQSFGITHGKLIPLSDKRYQFPVRNTK
jgi:hypothetical protein